MEPLPKRLARTTIYECPWVNLHRDRVELPTGHIIEGYHILDFGPGAAVMIVENADGQILLERVSRYPTRTIGWELPAGGIDELETFLAAAEREVFEETGYETHDHRHVYTFHPMNGIANATTHVVHCRAGARSGQIDENEVLAIRWFNTDEIWELLRRGEMTDGFSLIAYLLHSNQSRLENGG